MKLMLSQVFGLTLLGILAFALFGFFLSRILKRNDVADFLWGLGFVGIATLQAHSHEPLTFRGKLVLVLVALWGLRLSAHIGLRLFSSKKEDARYAQSRKEWGKKEPQWAFFKIFFLQSVMLGVIVEPVVWALVQPASPLTILDFVGLTLFVFGFVFESIADAQLAQFKKNSNNRGKVMNQGLWALSRHPNYFGEVLIWWGFFFMAVGLPYGAWTLVSPLLISFLLMKVTGVPLTEKMMEKKGPEFKAYVKATPSFLPFTPQGLISFVAIALILGVLDLAWLGGLMKSFYEAEQIPVRGFFAGPQDLVIWAAVGVYLFLALGLKVLAKAPTRLESLFRGATFGFCVYAVYDLTNIALVKSWSLNMSLVDMGWGALLCGIASIFI